MTVTSHFPILFILSVGIAATLALADDHLWGATIGIGFNDRRDSKIIRFDASGNATLACPWQFGISTRGVFPDTSRDRLLAATEFSRTTMVYTYKLGTCDVTVSPYQIPIANPLALHWSSVDNGFYFAGFGRNHTLIVYFSMYGGGLKQIVEIPDIVGSSSGIDGSALSSDGELLIPAIKSDNTKVTFVIDVNSKAVVGQFNDHLMNLEFTPDGDELLQAKSGSIFKILPTGLRVSICENVFKAIPVKGGFTVSQQLAYVLTADWKGTYLWTIDLNTCKASMSQMGITPWYMQIQL
ncbi:hypothetical protein GEMRC1_009232 [Eukaryota sp. GEM-RC1]